MMLVKEFAEIYNVSADSIYVQKSRNKPEWLSTQGSDCIIDENYLLKRQDYRKKLWLCSHDYYYYFTYVLGHSQVKIAQIVSEYFEENKDVWNNFFQRDLFLTIDKSIINTVIPTKLSKFIEFAEISIGLVHNKKRNNKEYLKRLKDMK